MVFNKVISYIIVIIGVSIDIASLVLGYVIIPFGSTLAVSITIIEIINKIKNRKLKKHYLESKILDLENRLREQKEKTDFMSEKIETVFLRTNETNKKLENIQELIKLLDDNIIDRVNKATSQYQVISPIPSHVSNPDFRSSRLNHDHQSHIQSMPVADQERQNSTVEYILKKLEDSSLTTREIQQIIGRTREHTSRLMKKLYEDRFVDRDMDAKPFKYTITDEGRKLLIKHSVSKKHHHSDLQKEDENPLNGLIENQSYLEKK